MKRKRCRGAAAPAVEWGEQEATVKVRDLLTVEPITSDSDTPLIEARQLMVVKHIRHLLVMDGPKALRHRHRPRHPAQPSVAGRDPRDAAVLMLDHRIGALPVVDGGVLVGIISETDLLRAFVKTA